MDIYGRVLGGIEAKVGGHCTYFDGTDFNRDSRDGSSEGCYINPLPEGDVKRVAFWRLK